jgi:homopolymeric O-antigen transport system permease protein
MTAVSSTTSELQFSKALRDVAGGFLMWELWLVLGWNDIRQRYRRTVLGPFWLTLSMGVMIGTIGFVYAKLFKQQTTEYLPYLTLGFIVWALVSGIVLECCTVFSGSEGIIRQVRAPYSVQIFRMLWRNAIIFAHNLAIYLVVMVLFNIRPNGALLFALPGFLLICLNGLWLGFVLGAMSARFRDLQPLVVNIAQIFFYVTPIVWRPEQLPDHPEVIHFNPFYYFVELLRAPLLGTIPSASVWLVAIATTVIGSAVALLFLARYRSRIAFWL